MQTAFEIIFTKKYLILSVIAIVIFNFAANFVGKEFAILAGNIAYIPIAGSTLVLAMIMIRRFRLDSIHSLAWISFAGYAISWFIAEMVWLVLELHLHVEPFPSVADIFYLVGYPFLFMFFVTYLQPYRSAATKKMMVGAISFSFIILIASLYFAISQMSDEDLFTNILELIYPIFDSIVAVPALVGVALFFKGQVNLMWSLLCFGILSVYAADILFVFSQNDESYFTGSPLEILFYWNYILISFGMYYHLKVFKGENNAAKLLR